MSALIQSPLLIDRTSAQREVVKSLKAELNALEQHQREKKSVLIQCEQAILRHRKEMENKRIEMQQAQSEVEELQDALDEDAIEEGRLDALKEQLEEAKEERSTHEGSYGDLVIAKDKAIDAMNVTRHQMADVDSKIQEAVAKVAKAESKATERANQRSAALREKNSAMEAVTSAQEEIERRQKEREGLEITVVEFNNQANLVCPRVAVDEGETAISLEKKYERLQRDLANAERR